MIGVIFTGGTIGSRRSGDYIGPDSAGGHKIIDLYEKKYGHGDFVSDSPCMLLSENIIMPDYRKMYDAVIRMAGKKVDGIILTHGSDTVMYTAALFSYIYRHEDVPLLIVCSNYVLENPESNGLINFAAAVDFIKNRCGQGVFVPYANRDGVVRIFYGSNILRHDIYSDELRAAGNAYYGDFSEGYFTLCDTVNPCADGTKYILPDEICEESGILFINPYPGMKYPEPDGYKAVVHTTYHSGTLCSAGHGFKEFVRRAAEKNIPIYLTGVQDGPMYESCMEYKESGLRILPYMTEASAYMKIWLETFGNVYRIKNA